MGIDVEFKIRTSPRLDRYAFEDFRARLHERFPDSDAASYRFPDAEWDVYSDVPTIEISCLERYYGKGYERGPWPQIREVGDWLVAALPSGAEVRYGGDCDEEWEEFRPWSEVVPENDQMWETVGTEPYRARFR